MQSTWEEKGFHMKLQEESLKGILKRMSEHLILQIIFYS